MPVANKKRHMCGVWSGTRNRWIRGGGGSGAGNQQLREDPDDNGQENAEAPGPPAFHRFKAVFRRLAKFAEIRLDVANLAS